jgi:putative MATE family efflux protein
MFIVLILNFFNIVLSYILIFGKIGFPKLGLKGAAIAYVLSYLIASIVGFIFLIYHNDIFRIKDFKIHELININEIKSLVKFSIPTAFEMSFWQFASIIITRAILEYGEVAYAAYQLGLQAESMSYMPAAGFGIAASTFVGQAVGSRNNELAKKYMKYLYKYAAIITSIAGLSLILFPNQIMSLLTNNKEVVQIGSQYLFIMGLVQLPQNIAGVLNGALRGAGYSKISMINVGVGLWGVRIPLVLIFTNLLKTKIYWIWIAMGIDLIVRFIFSAITFKKKDIYNTKVLIN